MAKNEVRTLSVILNELNMKVDEYNGLPEGDPMRVTLTTESKNLVNEYNELSLLTVYAKCMEADMPLKAFVETFKYNVVGIKDVAHKELQADGSKKDVYSRSVTENPDKMLELTKFIEWAAERNKLVAHSKDWKSKMLVGKNAIKTEWKKFHAAKGDSHSISIRKMKAGLQEMFDALIFIPAPSNHALNAVMVTSDIAKFAFSFANKLDPRANDEVSDGAILPEQNWKVIQMKILRSAVSGVQLIVDFCEEEEEDTAKKSDAPAKKAEDETTK